MLFVSIAVLRCVTGRVRTRRLDHDAYVAAACMLRDALQHSNKNPSLKIESSSVSHSVVIVPLADLLQAILEINTVISLSSLSLVARDS